jgi:hypothetical protein
MKPKIVEYQGWFDWQNEIRCEQFSIIRTQILKGKKRMSYAGLEKTDFGMSKKESIGKVKVWQDGLDFSQFSSSSQDANTKLPGFPFTISLDVFLHPSPL